MPNDNNNRRPHITVSSAESQSQSLPPPRDRYPPYLHPHEVAVIQQQHQVNDSRFIGTFEIYSRFYLSQIEIFRRQQQNREMQEYNERKEREFMQERERERERDEAQRRMDAEMAQRNFDRERLEQARLPYGQQSVWRPGPGGRLPDETIPFTAQCLINAIITENIARPPEPRDRFVSNLMRQSMPTNGSNLRMDSSLWFQANRDAIGRLQAENNGNSHSPNIINVDVDSTDLSRHSQSSALPQKNIKLNDITDAVISKDPSFGMHHHPPGAYLPPGQHFVRYSNAGSMPSKAPPTQSHAPSQQQQQQQPQMMGQEQIIATDQWKLNRRMQQQQHKEEMAKSGNNGGQQGRSTPDDRHIIRMAQSPSPRTKMSYEPVSPPDSGPHYYLQPKPLITINANDQRKLPPGVVPTSQENAPTGDATMVLKFVNHRIAEAMRNNDEKYGSNVSNEQHHASGDGKEGHIMKAYERPRSGSSMSGNGLADNDNDKSLVGKRESPSVYISQSTRPSPQPNQAFQQASMAFMYPFSALTIPQPGSNPLISPKAANEMIDANRQSSAPPQLMETRQVMSEQYDALSDED